LASPGGVVIRAVTGTPAGSPVVPSVPTGAIPLAQVNVVANDTTIVAGDITDRRKSAYNPSGARPLLPGDATSDAGAVAGELVYRTSTAGGGAGSSVWTGARWKSLGIPVFSTVSARDAEITAPVTGELAYSSDFQSLWTYLGSFWASREEQLVGWGRRLTTSSGSTSTVEVGILRIDGIVCVAGWPIKLEYGCHPDSTVGSDNARVEVRYKVGGSAGPGEAICFNSQTFSTVGTPRSWSSLFIPASTGTFSFALCIGRGSGSGTVTAFADSNRGSELKIYRTRTDVTNTGVNL
jgi:hypothetical protein